MGHTIPPRRQSIFISSGLSHLHPISSRCKVANLIILTECTLSFKKRYRKHTYHLPFPSILFRFHSIASTWSNCLTNASDVKELVRNSSFYFFLSLITIVWQIPEMFYLPELLMDINNVDFGTKNDGTPLRDVVLPPWAHNDPYLFMQLHRDALGTYSPIPL